MTIKEQIDAAQPVAASAASDGKQSAADQIIEMVQSTCQLITDDGEAYAIIEHDTHREVWPVDSSTFKQWVSMAVFKSTKRAPRAAAMQDALATIHGLALHDGEKQAVHLRSASDDNGGYWLDVADDQWRAIHITSQGWQVIEQPSVLFRRTKNTRPIPLPAQNGAIDDLLMLVNIDPQDKYLLVSVMLDWLRPDTAYPIVELIGDQGSGKSTTADRIRRFIDPNAVNLRSAPKSTEDIFVGARNNHMVCLNNLSRLTDEAQDALCNLATGGGFASRKLYTNDEETTYETKRPALLNGINAVATRPDLVSRVVRLTCPPLDGNGRRMDDRELEQVFTDKAPRALSFLLETMVAALAYLPQVKLTDEPRLLDYAKLGVSIGQVLDPVNGASQFEARYKQQREDAAVAVLDGMPVILALLGYLAEHSWFNGTYQQLLLNLESMTRSTDAGWPRSARGLSEAIGRAKPTLTLLGWRVVASEERTAQGYRISIENIKTHAETSALSTSSTRISVLSEQDVLVARPTYYSGKAPAIDKGAF